MFELLRHILLKIKSEISSCLDFLRHTYGIFGFTFELKLSTRPEKYLGEIETWNRAEKQLEEALNEFGQKWTLNPGDGAFYGPKVRIECKTFKKLDWTFEKIFQI